MVLPSPSEFPQKAKEATKNTVLRKNLKQVTGLIRQRRQAAFSQMEQGDTLRSLGQALRRKSLEKLPHLLEELEKNLTKRGIKVHWAETTEQANHMVLDLCRQHGVQMVVKGKSMVSEEMGLNAFLEERGIESVETDLGEFIVQLAQEPPSHILAPAIHLNREQVGRLFEKKLDHQYTADVEKITALAREILRNKFQEAGMGITGVNFAVADTGSLLLVENEGNGRMCSSVPPVHVALMGLEKVVASLEDIPPLIRLLTRSATGQSISTYFNWISGPRKPKEKDGPKEVHLILLDNGRTKIHSDKELRDTLCCIRCGACLNACPVYSKIGGHAYQSVYMGPIGKILTPQMVGLSQGGHLPGASTLCGACQEVCPVRIPIPDILLRLRKEKVQPTKNGRFFLKKQGFSFSKEKMLWKGWKILNSKPLFYRAMQHMLSLGMKLKKGEKNAAWESFRTLPKPAKKTLHQLVQERKKHPPPRA